MTRLTHAPVFTQQLTPNAPPPDPAEVLSLTLTAEERTKSRQSFDAVDREGHEVTIYLQLPRGTVLQDGDRLLSQTGERVLHIAAKPEPVLTVTASSPLALLKAAYHLGNRHTALEVTAHYLRLQPDPVLKQMLEQMGLDMAEDIAAFNPEQGAYQTDHPSPHRSHVGHSHSHEKAQAG